MTAAVNAVVGLLAATSTTKKSSSSSFTILIVYAAIAVAFYFFFWRPRQKRAQAAREQGTSGYEVGDEVLTAGGIVGHIIDIQGDRYTLETSVGASFVVLKQYVIRKLTPVEPEADDEEEGYHEPPAPDALEAGDDTAAEADDDVEDGDGHGDGEDDEHGGTDGAEGEPGPTDGVAPTGGGRAGKRRGRGRKDDPDPDGTDGPSII